MEPISDEVKRAWRKCRENCSKSIYGDCQTLACMAHDENGKHIKPFVFTGCWELQITNAYRHERAMRMKAEFLRVAFIPYEHEDNFSALKPEDENDPRHNWADADWEAAVDKEL